MEGKYLESNISGNGTNCYDDYCVESTLYRKIMGTILFISVWPFIVLDIKRFPLGRPTAALLGAVFMVLFAVVPQDQVYVILGDKGNLQTLSLLIGMMLLSYYYDREGILQYLTIWIFGKDKPFKHVLWKVCLLSAILSAIITNDATCLVLTPLLLAEHMKQERSKLEFPPLLLGIATSANIGSASTFFGNPQNAFIAANSRGQVSLLIFFVTTLPAAILGLAISVSLLYLCYFRTVWPKRLTTALIPPTTELNGKCNGIPIGNEGTALGPDDEELARTNRVRQNRNILSDSREEIALSYDRSNNQNTTSQISRERYGYFVSLEESTKVKSHQNGSFPNVNGNSKMPPASYETITSSLEYGAMQNYYDNHISNYVLSGRVSRLNDRSSDRFGSSMRLSDNSPLQENGPLETRVLIDHKVKNQTAVRSQTTCKQRFFIGWLILITCILVILLAIPPPPAVTVEFNLGLVPVAAGVMTMLMDTLVNRKYGFDAMMRVDWTMILMFMGLFIWLRGFENTLFPMHAFESMRTYMDLYSVRGALLFTVFVVVGSNVLSNVPLVILIADQLFNFECGGGTDNCTGQLTGTLLAWISTVAGNFTLIGSVANLIVAEKARNIADYRLSFWEYLKFGGLSTILVLFAGLPIVFFAGDNVTIM